MSNYNTQHIIDELVDQFGTDWCIDDLDYDEICDLMAAVYDAFEGAYELRDSIADTRGGISGSSFEIVDRIDPSDSEYDLYDLPLWEIEADGKTYTLRAKAIFYPPDNKDELWETFA